MNEPTCSICYLTLGVENNLHTGQKKLMSFAPNQCCYFIRPYIIREINCLYLLTLCPQKAWELHGLGPRGKTTGQKCSLAEEHWCKAERITATPLALASLNNASSFAHSELVGSTAAPMGFSLVRRASVHVWAECSPHQRTCGEQGTSKLQPPAPVHIKESRNAHQCL